MEILDFSDRIVDSCTNLRALEKAIRLSLGYSQRKMADRVLTCQCYLCWFETGSKCRKLPDGEFERIFFNTKCELDEQLVSYRYVGLERKLLLLCDILSRYLNLISFDDVTLYERSRVRGIMEDILSVFKERQE